MRFLITFQQHFLNEFVLFMCFIEFGGLYQAFVHNVKDMFIDKSLKAWK
jgi:hypothetical protein